jgi:hypothetical protein
MNYKLLAVLAAAFAAGAAFAQAPSEGSSATVSTSQSANRQTKPLKFRLLVSEGAKTIDDISFDASMGESNRVGPSASRTYVANCGFDAAGKRVFTPGELPLGLSLQILPARENNGQLVADVDFEYTTLTALPRQNTQRDCFVELPRTKTDSNVGTTVLLRVGEKAVLPTLGDRRFVLERL